MPVQQNWFGQPRLSPRPCERKQGAFSLSQRRLASQGRAKKRHRIGLEIKSYRCCQTPIGFVKISGSSLAISHFVNLVWYFFDILTREITKKRSCTLDGGQHSARLWPTVSIRLTSFRNSAARRANPSKLCDILRAGLRILQRLKTTPAEPTTTHDHHH